MDWLMFALTVPVLPVLGIFGAWLWIRPPAPTRGVSGAACTAPTAARTLG